MKHDTNGTLEEESDAEDGVMPLLMTKMTRAR